MKKVKINFSGFWEGFDYQHNFIMDVLREHYEVELCDNPEYLIYSCFSDDYLFDEKAVRIFYTAENVCPDWNLCDYAIGFENLFLGERYLRFPNYANAIHRPQYELMASKHISCDEEALKRDFCSFVVSKGNRYCSPVREEMFDRLSAYKTVHSGGRFKNNIGGPVPGGREGKLKFQASHKFSITFENCSHPGYITEKIMQGFAAKTVPIYWGAPDVKQYFNEKSFINVADFASVEEAARYIEKVDKDDRLYMSYMREPAILNNENSYERWQEDLEGFLVSIFEQNPESAYRRDRVGSGKRINLERKYCEEQKRCITNKVLRRLHIIK